MSPDLSILQAFVAIAFGPGGLTSYIHTGKPSRKGTPNAVKWRLTHITPGAIAGSAVLVSQDTILFTLR